MAGKPSFDREDLIERAQALFWKSGWAGTSMKDLEKGLNIRPGSFYAAFGSKDDLYELALDRYAATGQRRLKELTEEFGPIGALKVYLKALVNARSTSCRTHSNSISQENARCSTNAVTLQAANFAFEKYIEFAGFPENFAKFQSQSEQ